MMQQLPFRLETHHAIHHGLTITTGPPEPVRSGAQHHSLLADDEVHPREKKTIAGPSGAAQTD